MSTAHETYGKGGAGNVSDHVNHAAEEVKAHIPAENTAGRGGYGNIGEGPGHYDTSGGHAGVVESTGRGGAGNIGHKENTVTAVDKVIGSAQILFGKVINNQGLIEKGTRRKEKGNVPVA